MTGAYAIEVTPASAIASSRWFRGLILGAAHVGKTSAVLMTCPKPAFVINCDKRISLNPGTELCLEKKLRLDWNSCFVSSWDEMEAALKTSKQFVKERGVRTVVLDTLSGFSTRLLDQCIKASAQQAQSGKPDGRKYWPEYHKRLEGIVDRLHALDAHVVVCSHWEDSSSEDDDEDPKKTPKAGPGIVPMLGGASRKRAGQWFEDVLFLEKRKGEERVLRCSIDGVWGPASKSLPGVSEVPADITAFIKAKEDRMRKLVASARGR